MLTLTPSTNRVSSCRQRLSSSAGVAPARRHSSLPGFNLPTGHAQSLAARFQTKLQASINALFRICVSRLQANCSQYRGVAFLFRSPVGSNKKIGSNTLPI